MNHSRKDLIRTWNVKFLTDHLHNIPFYFARVSYKIIYNKNKPKVIRKSRVKYTKSHKKPNKYSHKGFPSTMPVNDMVDYSMFPRISSILWRINNPLCKRIACLAIQYNSGIKVQSSFQQNNMVPWVHTVKPESFRPLITLANNKYHSEAYIRLHLFAFSI